MTRIAFALVALLAATQALAQGMDEIDRAQFADWRAKRAGDCFWFGTHCGGNRYYYRRRHYQRTYYADRDPTRVYGYRYRIEQPVTVYGDSDRGRECLPLIRAIGDERVSLEKAKDAAARAWMGTVRFHHGEKWLEIDNARHVRFTCSRSSVNDTVLGKIQEGLNVTHSRCEISAVPCRARPERER